MKSDSIIIESWNIKKKKCNTGVIPTMNRESRLDILDRHLDTALSLAASLDNIVNQDPNNRRKVFEFMQDLRSSIFQALRHANNLYILEVIDPLENAKALILNAHPEVKHLYFIKNHLHDILKKIEDNLQKAKGLIPAQFLE